MKYNNDSRRPFYVEMKFRSPITHEFDEGWKIIATKPNGISNLKLYADNELVFEGRYKELIDIIKRNNGKY